MPPDLPELDYDIYEGEKVYPAHDAFTVDTWPVSHELCGPLDLVPKFRGAALDLVNGPFTGYDPTTYVFTAESEDVDLADNTYSYSVSAEFSTYPIADYPTVSTASNADSVNFGNSCGVATLVATA